MDLEKAARTAAIAHIAPHKTTHEQTFLEQYADNIDSKRLRLRPLLYLST